MKAQFIFEDQHFQRGQDPKSAMDVGIGRHELRIFFDLGMTASNSEDMKASNIVSIGRTYSRGESFGNYYATRVILKDGRKGYAWPDVLRRIGFNPKTNRQNVFESQHFHRGGDPLDTLDIGLVQDRKLKKIFQKMRDIAMEYDVDINEVKLDHGLLFCSVEISGRRYCIGLSPDYINREEDSHEYNCAWEDMSTHDFSNDNFDTEYDTVEQAAKWIRDEIDNHAQNYTNESQHFSRGEDPLDTMDIG